MKFHYSLLTISLLLFTSITNAAPITTSATERGSHPVASTEYRLPASLDSDVLSGRKTEIWAKVFYPEDMNTISDKLPLIIFLHGNHGTCGIGSNPRQDSSCSYTDSGTCPTGYQVTPNHEGYNYLADHLASWGYIVISINANRGITCGGGVKGDFGLNLARGKLVLKHLSLLHTWSNEGHGPNGLENDGWIKKIDFSEVGLVGHSRGGEGVRAAYNLFNDKNSSWPAKIPNLSIKAIYEIGAVDGQTDRVLDANGIVWNQLLPMCDGDVSTLEGRYPFERMLKNHSESENAQKSLYEVWGANHNFFNTEWQDSDASRCSFGKAIFSSKEIASIKQQTVAIASITAFFRSHLSKDATINLNQHFNPLHSVASEISTITQIDRDFIVSPAASEMAIIDDFNREAGVNSSGNKNVSENITYSHENISNFERALLLKWNFAGNKTFFESVASENKNGINISNYKTLDFRIARVKDKLNNKSSTDFGIRLEDSAGNFSNEVMVSQYAFINGPGNWNTILKTVRIPLAAFSGINLNKLHGVRFIFDATPTGAIYLANIRMMKHLGLGTSESDITVTPPIMTLKPTLDQMLVLHVPARFNRILSIKPVISSMALKGKPGVEIRLSSQEPFPVMNSLPELKIGNKTFKLSYYSDMTELKELTFTLTPEEYQSLTKNSLVNVTDGKIWEFGKL